jgi:hypothetical protein
MVGYRENKRADRGERKHQEGRRRGEWEHANTRKNHTNHIHHDYEESGISRF